MHPPSVSAVQSRGSQHKDLVEEICRIATASRSRTHARLLFAKLNFYFSSSPSSIFGDSRQKCDWAIGMNGFSLEDPPSRGRDRAIVVVWSNIQVIFSARRSLDLATHHCSTSGENEQSERNKDLFHAIFSDIYSEHRVINLHLSLLIPTAVEFQGTASQHTVPVEYFP